MIVRNFTPYAVDFRSNGGCDIRFEPDPSGPAWIEESTEGVVTYLVATMPDPGTADWAGFPIVRKVCREAMNIPFSEPDTVFIVSAEVAQAYPGRWDFVVPADFIIDEAGEIVACTSFATCTR